MHIVLASVTVILMLVAIAVGAAALGRPFRLYSLSSLVTLVVFGVLTFLDAPRVGLNMPTPWIGVWERINIGVFLLWVVVLAIALLLRHSYSRVFWDTEMGRTRTSWAWPGRPVNALVAIKLLHTAVWAVLAGSVLALPAAAVLRRFDWAIIMTVTILVECGVLALNRGRCPLTGTAARFTVDRADNFDIYLPLWLARHNKAIFGALFAINELIVLKCWLQ